MTATMKLFEELARRGVSIAVENGQLKVTAPKGTLTDDLRWQLTERKHELIARLQATMSDGPVRQQVIVEHPEADFEPFPLSDLQLGFYVANDPYMEFHVRPHCYMEMDRRDFDIDAYERAWNQMLADHRREICIVDKNSQLQTLLDRPQITILRYDLTRSSTLEVDDALARIRNEMCRRELPLDSWPWFDLRVSTWMSTGRPLTRVHYNHNNFFIDGFGSALLLQELEARYREPGKAWPRSRISYRDAVLGLEKVAQSPSGEVAKRYWMSRLHDLPGPPEIPQRANLNRRCRASLTRREGRLAKEKWDAFKACAARHGITPSNAVITAYAYVVATWSNSNDFIFSQMVTRRNAELHPDMMRLWGNFVSLYPLEIRLRSELSFADNARKIQNQVLEDMKHLQFGGMRVFQELNKLKGSFGTAPSPFVVGSGLLLSLGERAGFTVLETSQTVLDHQFFELGDGSYQFIWDLLEEFFPGGVVDEMWASLEALLSALAENDDAWKRTRLGLLAPKSLDERTAQNRTAKSIVARTLQDAVEEQVGVRPHAPALVDLRGDVSYADLDRWSAEIAETLCSHLVRPGELIAVVMERTAELFAAVFGVLRAGAAYVPIDPDTPHDRIDYMLENINTRIVLTRHEDARRFSCPAGIKVLTVNYSSASMTRVAGVNTRRAFPKVATDSLAYVIYTSGSTGRPKGVMIEHASASNTIRDINDRFGINSADKLLGVSAFNFDLSVFDIFGAVDAGACLIFPHPEKKHDPGHWIDLIEGHSVTVWNSVPALMSLLVEAAQSRDVELPSLRLVLLSGDKIPLSLHAQVLKVAPNAEVISLGGATEAAIWSIYYRIGQIDPDWVTIPYGYPLANQTWHVMDRHGEPCPTWVRGELYIGGVGLARGYWEDEQKTSRSFVTSPTINERLYRTGDLGRYLPGGAIEWMGRADFQVKIQGNRIELGEIEAALVEHIGVQHAVVIVDAAKQIDTPRLFAHVVLKGEPVPQTAELETFLRHRLPTYMIPHSWKVWDHLPLTHNGKVDRSALLQASTFAADSGERAVRNEPPGNEIEARILGIWQAILKDATFGVTHDFFELGGQSFDAVRIFAKVKEAFGKGFTLREMWDTRTVRALAHAIEHSGAAFVKRHIVALNSHKMGRALFLVHPASGSVMAYASLGHVLDRPLYGIQTLDRPFDGLSATEIPALARHYVESIRACDVGGAIALGGWSTGAIIAFEMAAQLEALGETVAELYLLDGPTPAGYSDLTDRQLFPWFVSDLNTRLSADEFTGENFDRSVIEGHLRRVAWALGLDGRSELAVNELATSYAVFRELVVAANRYQPKKISADVTVVRVTDNIVREFAQHPALDRKDWGWSPFTSGTVRTMLVQGSHYSFLNEASVRTWSRLFDKSAASVGGRVAAKG